MSFIKNIYQVKKLEEMDKKIKKIFSVPTSTVYEIKQNLENRNKRLKKKFFLFNIYCIFSFYYFNLAGIFPLFSFRIIS